MPLTAVLDDITLDATLEDLGAGLQWSAIHRARPRPELRCPECSVRVHAKRSSSGLRFFAHDSLASSCSLVGESPEHRRLKNLAAVVLRQAGWEAHLEAAGPGYRADVLAVSPSGRRVVLEIQLSGLSAQEVTARTALHHTDGCETVWFSRGAPVWEGCAPTLRLGGGADPVVLAGLYRPGEVPENEDGPCLSTPCRDLGGCAGHLGWFPLEGTFSSFLAELASYAAAQVGSDDVTGARVLGDVPFSGWALTPLTAAAAVKRLERRRQSELGRLRREASDRSRTRERLTSRRQAGTDRVVELLRAAGHSQIDVLGSHGEWAYGQAVSSLDPAGGWSLRAVVSPVARWMHLSSPGFWDSVILVVHDEAEMQRLAVHVPVTQRFYVLSHRRVLRTTTA